MDIEYKELLAQALNIILVFLPSSICLALAGLPLMSMVGQILAKIRQRSFYDKCARQLARLAMWLGFLLIAGSCYEIWPYLQNISAMFRMDDNTPALHLSYVLCWAIWTCSWFFSSLHFSTWNMLKNFPLLHRFLAVLGAAFAFLGIYALIVIRQATGMAQAGENLTLPEIISPPMDFSLMIVGIFIPPLVFAMAGGLGAAWLALRRTLDDFGRDYYNLMTPWCASWARNSWFAAWLLLIVQGALDLWAVWEETGMIPPDYPFRDLGMFMVLWFIPVLLWHIVVGSLTPMRHKLAIFIAPLMLMGFVYVMLQ